MGVASSVNFHLDIKLADLLELAPKDGSWILFTTLIYCSSFVRLTLVLG